MSLFNEYEARTDDGNMLGERIYKAVRPVIVEAIAHGHFTREVEAIALEEVAQICAEIRIRRALTKSGTDGGVGEDPGYQGPDVCTT